MTGGIATNGLIRLAMEGESGLSNLASSTLGLLKQSRTALPKCLRKLFPVGSKPDGNLPKEQESQIRFS